MQLIRKYHPNNIISSDPILNPKKKKMMAIRKEILKMGAKKEILVKPAADRGSRYSKLNKESLKIQHPNELYLLLKLFIAMKKAEQPLFAEPHREFCYSMLHRVSSMCVLMIQQLDNSESRRSMDASGSRNKADNMNKGKAPVIEVDNENDDEPVNDDQNINDENNDGDGRRSWVWDHFKYVKGATKVRCPYCTKMLAAGNRKNGTSTMGQHLKSRCKKSPIYKKPDLKNQSTLGFKPVSKGGTGGSLANHNFSHEKCRNSLARMCIKDNRPFSVVDDDGFREFLWDINPMFKVPSRWTVAKDCLLIYKEEKEKLMKLLKDKTVALTTDTWTSVQNYNYMCLTAHWVDDDWVLRKKILNFCQIANHKGRTIGGSVYRCLQEWGIERVITITVDNASSNDGAIKYLETMLKGPHAILDCKYLHLRCCAHIINLVVRDGLEENFDSINKIRNAVRYVRSSPSRYENFKKCIAKEKIACKRKPCLDVETRWNSTFLMLETAEKFEAAFERLHLIDINYRCYFRGEPEDDCEGSTRKRKRNERTTGAPQKEDWEKARYFMDYLRIFFDVTKKVSGSKYTTSNIFFGELVTMHATISKMCLSGDEKKKNMALSMKTKFDKYWDNIDNMNFLLHAALVLDPRNKMLKLEYWLGLIYSTQSRKCAAIIKLVGETLEALYDEYKMKVDEEKEHTKIGCSSSTSIIEDAMKVDYDEEYEKFLQERGHGVNKTELEIYLADGMEKRVKGDDTFDVLGWWKLNSLKFPVLSQVARHVLSMPISTIASETAFGTGGRVIDQFRNSLTSKTAEALICTQDWLQSTPRDLQDMSVHGLQLQEMVEVLEKLEVDEFPTTENILNENDSPTDEDCI